MYTTDLTRISLESFEEILTTADLLPSRRVLADHISEVVPRLEALGIENLEDLRLLLADKRRHNQVAEEIAVDSTVVTLLGREVNAYQSRPVPLAKLESLTDRELERLAEAGIRSSKDIYDGGALPEQRRVLARDTGIEEESLAKTLQLSNLVRINGVGPAFAHFLVKLGVYGPEDVLAMSTPEIVDRYEQSVADQPGQPTLRAEDIEYCKRFAVWLSSDVVW